MSGDCSSRASFYSLVLNTLLQQLLLNVSSQTRSQGLVQPSHHTYTQAMRSLHIMHVVDMRINWMPFHLPGHRFDCIFNVGGYKHDRMSSQAAIVVTVTLLCQSRFWKCQIMPSYLWWKALKHSSHVATRTIAFIIR